MKKRVVLLALCLVWALASFAQVPQKVNYQGIARHASGNPLANTNIGLRLSIHSLSPTGTVVYQETHNLNTNAFGLFTLHIGTGTVVSGLFSTIPWWSSTYYFESEMDPNGGTNYSALGTAQLFRYLMHCMLGQLRLIL